MPLGQRVGDKSDSRYCGVETDFIDDMPHVLTHNLSGGFDFVVAPLVDPSYRPSFPTNSASEGFVLPVAASDLIVSPAQWSSHVVGKISSWIDLDSEDEKLRMDSETALKQEISWASHLSVQACLLPPPKKGCCSNYARSVNQILQGITNMQLWLRLPLVKSGSIENESFDESYDSLSGILYDSWETWNSFRLLCEHHIQLCVALDIQSSLPSINSLLRWFGEPVRAAIIHTDAFLTNARGYPCLSKRHQKLITAFFDFGFQIVISGSLIHSMPQGRLEVFPANDNDTLGEGAPLTHELKPYLEYVAHLYQRMDPLPEQERFELNYRDFLQAPLQPLMDNLEAQTYETFEKDTVKYNQAAEEVGRKIKVYAVEKNPNAVVTLHSLIKLEGWESIVTVISCDMRCWDAPEMADILVSELLGSFGDNELSPECLDGAQRFLKPDGISIPSSYTSYLQPITTTKLYNDVKANKDLAHMETPYVVKLHKVARLAQAQPVFTFHHPEFSPNRSNQRYVKLEFEIPPDTGSTLVHGFAGYFDAVLYGDIYLSIEPSKPTPTMFSWFPIFFPLRTPVYVPSGSHLEVQFWRCCAPAKVWYEWCVTSPITLPVHNVNGRSYWVGL